MYKNVRTSEDLQERPVGWDFAQHLGAVRAAIQEHLLACTAIGNKAEDEGRSDWLASERREYDRHTDEVRRLDLLRGRLEESPEGNEIDYTRVLNVGPVDTRDASPDNYTGTDGGGRWRHTGGGHVYTQHDRRTSWVKDLVTASLQGDAAAGDRLRRNNREAARAPELRALSATDGAGGDFVPPVWLMTQWIRLARAGRVIADGVAKMPLPPGTDTVNLPRVVSGTATAVQATQNTAVQATDATTDTVSAAVVTIAGQQTLSWQLIDQSPVSVDEVILQDLLADLATKVDQFVISNNAAAKVGILNVAGANAVTYTDAAPTVSKLYPKIADAVQQIHTGRYLPPTKIFMHPRRWAWFTASSDAQARPLVVPTANMPQNVLAAMGDVSSEGFVGQLQGIPVFVDPNIPINLGVGTNEDRIIIARANDVILMESGPRAQAFPQPLAAQLSMLLVVHEYLAIHASRYPKAISIISGTGLIAPTF